MAASDQGRRWRRCRIAFRVCRITVLLVVLLVVAVGVYLNQVGLPGFIKRPLLEKLHARGVDLQFSRLRLRWRRGIVADDVRFGQAHPESGAPQLFIKEVELELDHAALAKFQITVDSLILHGGRLDWSVGESNEPSSFLSATNLEAQVRFRPGDEWELDRFKASFAGAKLQISGSITNATAFRDWPLFHPHAPAAQPSVTHYRLHELARIIDQLGLVGTPLLSVTFNGDARDSESFNGKLALAAEGAVTPWGTFTNGLLSVRLTAPNSPTNQPSADCELTADAMSTHWGAVSNLLVTLHATAHENLTNLVQARLDASATRITTPWAQAAQARVKIEWTHSMTNSIPLGGTIELRVADARAYRASAGGVELTARMDTPAATGPRAADAGWAWWAALEPYALDWNCRLRDVRAEDPNAGVFEFKELACGGFWRAPDLTITNAHAELYRGRVDARAAVNVATRATAFEGTADFDAQKAAPLLNDAGREWLHQYSWEDPPWGHAIGGVILPAWTNHQPDWQGGVLPTVWLQGELMVGNAAFRGVPFSSATFHFNLSNEMWNLPDLVAVRPEGRVELVHDSDLRTKRFYYRAHSTVDVYAFRKLLPPEAQKGMDLVVLTRPPVIDAEVWGEWHDPDQIGVKAHVAVTNFAFRGETATRFEGDVQYTNKFIVLSDARLERGDEFATAGGLGIDPLEKKIYLTNGYGRMAPAPFFHAIGPLVEKVMEPYHFLKPPTVHAHGVIPLVEGVDPDLHFTAEGGPFNWMRFNLDHVSGGADWVGQGLTFTNVQASLYGGNATWAANFDFSPKVGNDYSFNLTVNEANLQAFMSDMFTTTNHLEGRLNGRLNITHANSSDARSWFGNGQVDLRDGLIWAIPIFGVFSPMLDSFSPGLGESRADRGAATFTITNSVIRSDDLEIRSPALRMMYRGTVGFDGRVDAVVEAKLLRDVPVLGWLLSTAFSPVTRLFEYKVTGTLTQPKAEPLFLLSKILLMPFAPFQAPRESLPANPPVYPEVPPDWQKTPSTPPTP